MCESFTFISSRSATHHLWNGHFSTWHSSQVPTEIPSARWRSRSHISVRPLLSQPCSSRVREYGLDNTKYPEVIKRFRAIFERWRKKGLSERTTRSPVWDRFGFKAAEDGKAVEDGKPICLHCKRSVAARWGNTNVTKHIMHK